MITRLCRVCNLVQSLDNFYWYATSSGKKLQRHTCKECIKVAVRRHRSENGPRSKHTQIKWTYNLDSQKYDELMSKGCAVCGSFEGLSVDHDHKCCPQKTRSCGKCVRGVLCRKCNWAEGLLGGDINRIIALATYLLEWEKVGESA